MTGIINKDDSVLLQNNIIDQAKEVLTIEASSITRLIDRLDNVFVEAIDILYNCNGRVIITGMGKSGIIGKKIAATLSSTGTPAYFLHPAESSHGDSGVLTRDDVVIAISNSGETLELLQLLPIIKRFGLKLIAMTGKKSSTLAQKADATIDISVEKEACPHNLAPTASTTATLAMGDAIAICLLNKRGFTPEDFLVFHPAGSLGKGILWKVEDLMISGNDLPIVRMFDKFHDSIPVINDKKVGVAIVVDKDGRTVGVITDGDIRRTVLKHNQIDQLLVNDVMTRNTEGPKVISKTALAATALNIMEKYSITSLIINNSDGTPEGLVHIHNLLKAGVA